MEWLDIGAHRCGIERLARDFSVEITRQWPGDEGITTLQPRIKNGSKVEVLIGDELVITGWVEATPVRYDARSVSTVLPDAV